MKRTEHACQNIAPTKENKRAGKEVLTPQPIIDADARQAAAEIKLRRVSCYDP